MNRQILKNIKSLRELKGFSQKGIADQLRITQSSYARFETGAKKTEFDMLEQVAEAFGVDVCTIIHFHEQGLGGQEGRGDRQEKELKQLRERETYLNRLNEQLTVQLNDKQEIIELLRSKKGGEGSTEKEENAEKA
ncbi:MAG: helix-turn-helix domain-containing protein [Flavobacteriales bacterium]